MTSVPPASLRLFLGLWPSPAMRSALQEHADVWQWPASARRTHPERLHITLHFLGEVPATRLADLQQGLAMHWAGCELVLDRAEVWPGGIAVLEAQEVPRELAQLHAQLGERLQELAMPVETRRYRPHVTFARKAVGARPPGGFAPLRWMAGPEFLLVRSLPGGRGYEPIQRFA